jgi:putative phosphoribosyl transferase
MVGRDIGQVRAPTLLIAGEFDRDGLAGSREVYRRLTCLKQLEIIPRATHAFSERRGLEKMISAATQWFDLYLIPRSAIAASAAGRRRDATALQ